MIKIYFKKISVLITIICFSVLICIGAVCAVNDTDNGSVTDSNVIELENINNNNLAVEQNINGLNSPIEKTSKSQGTFDELKNEFKNINSGDTYNFTKDYTFELNGPIPYWNRVIDINSDNITINGNGHTINAGGVSEKLAIFKVLGDNVKITNLTFINSNTYDRIIDLPENLRIQSPVSWFGNNGTLSDCIFAQNSATLGGALRWSGDDGKISKCIFINNTAFGVGGAMYVIGANNLIENCTFINSASQLSGESVYYERKCVNYRIKNSTFSSLPFIEGYKSNLDVNYLYNNHYIEFADKRYNMVSLIYKSITLGGINALENGIQFYARYLKESGTYILTLQRNYNGGVNYVKDFYFNNLNDLNSAFIALNNDDYTVYHTFLKNIEITGNAFPPVFGITSEEVEYLNAVTTTASSSFEPILKTFTITEKEQIIGSIMNKITGFDICNVDLILNINFKKAFTICAPVMDLSKLGYFTVIIDGNGSTFYANSGDHDEYKWAIIGQQNTLVASNMILQKFNTAIENIQGGIAILSHMKFDQNRMDYTIDRDWGAAIINTGLVVCTYCFFTNNYAKNGGAIFNQGLLIINDTGFINNKAYGKGNDICIGKGGQLIIQGINITPDTTCNLDICFAKSISADAVLATTFVTTGVTVIAGLIAGAFTVNPGIGLAVGAGVAALVGTGTGLLASSYIISKTYDCNYNRLKTCLVVTGCTVLCGVVSNFINLMGSESLIGAVGVAALEVIMCGGISIVITQQTIDKYYRIKDFNPKQMVEDIFEITLDVKPSK